MTTIKRGSSNEAVMSRWSESLSSSELAMAGRLRRPARSDIDLSRKKTCFIEKQAVWV